jgi:trehalose-6-phosphatase
MQLDVCGQFIVGVVRPRGGWSKGRPIAYIEEDDKCVPLFDLLIPNDLDDEGIARYVSEKFRAFAQSGKRGASSDPTVGGAGNPMIMS